MPLRGMIHHQAFLRSDVSRIARNPMNARQEFLLTMYSEAWRNIERHILVVWQTAGVVGATFAALLFAEKVTVPFDLAISFELLVIGWLYAHILDAEFWFRRNLHIIQNIERQFLDPADASHIHPFFLPRPPGSRPPSLDHLAIQKQLARALFVGVLGFHAVSAIQRAEFGLASILPAAVSVVVIVWVGHFKVDRASKHAELERRSPGKQIEDYSSC